jgi:thiosulfate/3-mercaptopyruvate sulfurtransferase|tara:strand:- start:2110 stop:2940 length:831 start_codon:yes stop_codon:yes gene_type:complete
MKNLVSTDWLEQNLKTVRVLDGSWHMPNTNRNAFEEFNNKHIDNALFFDLDKNSDQKSSLPHMLPNKSTWEKIISEFGIKNSDHIIIYDNSDVISSCRIWYNFLYFGHNPNLVSVLDGGLKKWLMDNKKISNLVAKFPISSYLAKENSSMVLEKNQIDLNIQNKKFELIDARSKERFLGLQPEPRKELRSGNIKGSKNIPFVDLINKDDSTFKNKKQIKSIFNQLNLDPTNNIAFTCGSGVTACVLGLANSIVSGRNPLIYDGSWSEYGLIKNEKI